MIITHDCAYSKTTINLVFKHFFLLKQAFKEQFAIFHSFKVCPMTCFEYYSYWSFWIGTMISQLIIPNHYIYVQYVFLLSSNHRMHKSSDKSSGLHQLFLTFRDGSERFQFSCKNP